MIPIRPFWSSGVGSIKIMEPSRDSNSHGFPDWSLTSRLIEASLE